MRLRFPAPFLLLLGACESGVAPEAAAPAPAAVSQVLAARERRAPTETRQPLRVRSHTRLEPAGAVSVDAVDAVVTRLDVGGVEGTHALVVEFYSPSGEPFAREEAALQQSATGIQTAELTVPVRGTHISQHSLAGTWTTKVLLDGQLVAADSFTLER